MTCTALLDAFHRERTIAQATLDGLATDPPLRRALLAHLRARPDHEFALALLAAMVAVRKRSAIGMSGDLIMLAAYLLGMHGRVEDCLAIWIAKHADFDLACYLDPQLLVGAGVDATLAFLAASNDPAAPAAHEYILACKECGDYDDAAAYFTPSVLPWWI